MPSEDTSAWLRRASVGPHPQLGQLALDRGWITQARLEEILEEQRESQGIRLPLGALLLTKGYLTAEQLTELINEQRHHTGSIKESDASPRWLGRYKVLRKIGAGRAGMVFMAEDPIRKKPVAIKVLPESIAANVALTDRLCRDLTAVSRLRHPGILPVYEVGIHGARFFIVMEYKGGGTLRAPLVPIEGRIVDIARDIATTLAFAHSQDICHGSLKLTNILFGEEERPVLSDFGQASLYRDPKSSIPNDSRNDIHALGVILYEQLSHRSLSEGEKPVSPSKFNLSVPRSLDSICLKALEQDETKGYSRSADLAADLAKCLSKDPMLPEATDRRSSFSRQRLLLIILLAALSAAIAFFLE